VTAARRQKFTLGDPLIPPEPKPNPAFSLLLQWRSIAELVPSLCFIWIFYYRAQNKQFHLFKARQVIGLLPNA
jgi:hypothetical protein